MTIEVRSLTRRFEKGGLPAIEDVSFTAPQGSITTLLGPSGAGKSTILRSVAGLESPDSGSIFLAGEEVTHLPPQRRGVGLVFQGYALFRHLDVRANVAFGLSVQGWSRKEIDARVDELLARVQLSHLAHRHPSQLSGGEKQRVAFARALAVRPRVLLLDEPFAALDARVRRELRGWLKRLHDETHLTTLLVTHDQDEARELSDKVVVLLGGRLVQEGTPEETWSRPRTPEVASLLHGPAAFAPRLSVAP
jgi:sulfate/thiosulfate transport system ATP-binding protein